MVPLMRSPGNCLDDCGTRATRTHTMTTTVPLASSMRRGVLFAVYLYTYKSYTRACIVLPKSGCERRAYRRPNRRVCVSKKCKNSRITYYYNTSVFDVTFDTICSNDGLYICNHFRNPPDQPLLIRDNVR